MTFHQKKSNQAYFYAAALLGLAAAYAFASGRYAEGGLEAAGLLLALLLGFRGRGWLSLRRRSVKYRHRKEIAIRYEDIAFVLSTGKNLRFFFRNGSELLLDVGFLTREAREAAASQIESIARRAASEDRKSVEIPLDEQESRTAGR